MFLMVFQVLSRVKSMVWVGDAEMYPKITPKDGLRGNISMELTQFWRCGYQTKGKECIGRVVLILYQVLGCLGVYGGDRRC